MAHMKVSLPSGQVVTLVPREELRVTTHGRTFCIPTHLQAILKLLPTPQVPFDYGFGGKVKFPILGNDREGDCFYVAPLHAIQAWVYASTGIEPQFVTSQVLARYNQLSGGDNGLGDQQVFPEWKSGMVGPNGPYKVKSIMTINPQDKASITLASWAFGGVIYTCSLLNTWLRNIHPGAIWDANGRPDPNAGHAMYLSGEKANGNWQDETWELFPAIELTNAGMLASDPEIITTFSDLHFKPDGTCAFTGMTWDQKNTLWQQCGGKDVGPSPFPTPTPSPIPTPTPTPAPQVWPSGTIPDQLVGFKQGKPIQGQNLRVLGIS